MRNSDANHLDKSLNECDKKSPIHQFPNTDPAEKYCGIEKVELDLEWLEQCKEQDKTGIGKSRLCDPMTTGQIINDLQNPDRNTLYRYSKGIRGTDEAVMDIFRNIHVIDENGKAHSIPIIWATQEKAVAAVVQDNVRKDNTLVVDRIRLPMMAISSTEIQPSPERYTYHKALDFVRGADGKPGFTFQEKRPNDTVFGFARGVPINIVYTLHAWTLYLEDMNQIVEQIMSKFAPVAYIRVRGVKWEVIVKLDSVANNLEVEPGDQAIRVVKFQFNLTAETYIPQPIARRKPVWRTKVEFVDGMTEDEITNVLGRLEEQIKELEC